MKLTAYVTLLYIFKFSPRHIVPVETVKEMIMTSDDKKKAEEKESETTEETLSKTETQSTDPAKSPPQKVKSRSNRFVFVKQIMWFLHDT